MKKLYHSRINMLLVRADGPFDKNELQSVSAMMQAVCDALGKASKGAIRVYVEVEPSIRPLPTNDESERGAKIMAHQRADETSIDKTKKAKR